MKKPVRVTVTGAAGQISYSLLFRIAAGNMLGPDQPVILQMLEIEPAMNALKGVCMELDDCAFPLLQGMVATSDANEAFGDSDYALLVGARPRTADIERKDLLHANAQIFSAQGKAMNASASKNIRCIVVGNPANTNALIAMANAPDIKHGNITAMTRLDHNRAVSQIAEKTGNLSTDVTKMTIWGNHSATQYPDISNTLVKGKAASGMVDQGWYRDTMIPDVQQRGTAIINARGQSSAASAANAAMDHIRDWVLGTPKDDWVSMAIPSDGSYNIPEGLMYSFPCTCTDGEYSIVQGLDIDDFSRGMMDATAKELSEERDDVKELL